MVLMMTSLFNLTLKCGASHQMPFLYIPSLVGILSANFFLVTGHKNTSVGCDVQHFHSSPWSFLAFRLPFHNST